MKTYQGNPPDVVFEHQDTDHIVSAFFDVEEAIQEEEYYDSALTITVVSNTKESRLKTLNRLVLKSDSCTLEIPEIEMEVPEGKGRFCTCKEFVEEVYDNLKDRIQDRSLLDNMKKIVDGELNFTLVLSDPLGNSRVQCLIDQSLLDEYREKGGEPLQGLDLYKFDPDVTYEVKKRSLKVDVDYGIANTNPLYQAVTGEEGLALAIDLIKKSQKIVGFTGAGVSTESGVPAFRNVRDYSDKEDDKSIWDTYDVDMFQYSKIMSDEKIRTAYYVMHHGVRSIANSVQPNPSHYFFSQLEKQNKILKLVTQNIDGLYQRAGVSEDKIIELHGTLHRVKCQQCGFETASDPYFDTLSEKLAVDGDNLIYCPSCDKCGGILKVSTISFGQNLEVDSLLEAFECAKTCDLMIVMGSSLVVAPANKLPLECIDRDIPVILMNIGSTSYDTIVSVLLNDKCGETCAKIMEQI